MAGYAPLPAYQAPNALNFQPLSQGIDDLAKGIKEGRANALNRDIGQAAANGDWKGAQNAAFGGGQIDQGMGIANYKQKFDQIEEDRLDKFKTHSAGIAQAILADPDPARAQAQWQRLVSSDPRWQSTLSQYGVNPADYNAGASLVVAHARGYRDPIEEQMKRSQLATSDLGRQATVLDMKIKQRELDNPAQKFQVLPDGASLFRENPRAGEAVMVHQGQPKQDEFTKKQIFESDQGVQSGVTALSHLDKALELSGKAYSGFGAETRGGLVDSLAPWATPDASATVQLKQVTTSQALESLKTTFGGNPTEGERKILLDVQGSANQPRATRDEIFNRAKQAVAARIQYNQRQAAGLRSGGYFKQGGQPQTSVPGQQPAQQNAPSAPVQLNGKTYTKINGQWVEQ